MNINTSTQNSAQKPNYDVDFLETLTYEWVRRSMYFSDFRLTNTKIKVTANKFRTILNLKSFTTTKEWVEKFRTIYNIKDMSAANVQDIGYKCPKSVIPLEIFKELEPQWISLDPTAIGDTIVNLNIGNNLSNTNRTCDSPDSVASEFDTLETNITPLFDIEEELPVCTIFGKKTLQNVANIISTQNSIAKNFEPMIVCTDPKNPNPPNKIPNSSHKDEVNKIFELINAKMPETESNTSSQGEFIDEYIKEIVRVPDPNEASTQKQAFNAKRFRSLRINFQKTESQSSEDNKSSDSIQKPSTRVKLKRKAEESFDKHTKIVNLETNEVDESVVSPVTPMESEPSQQTETVDNTNSQSIENTDLEIIQSVPTGEPVYTYQIPAYSQNPATMPYMTTMTTNLQTPILAQPTTLTPIVLHFHSPMQLQSTDMFSTAAVSPALINLTQIPTQASFIQSIDGTQQILPQTNFSNLVQNQLIPQIYSHQNISTEISTNTDITIPSTPAEIVPPNLDLNTLQSVANLTPDSPATILQSPALPIIQTITSESTSTKSITTNLKVPAIVHQNLISKKPIAQSSKNSKSTLSVSTTLPSQSTTTSTSQNSTIITSASTSIQADEQLLVKMPKMMKKFSEGTRFSKRQPLSSKDEVMQCIKLMRDFALSNKNSQLKWFLESLEKEVVDTNKKH